jgi:hypothetical protein
MIEKPIGCEWRKWEERVKPLFFLCLWKSGLSSIKTRLFIFSIRPNNGLLNQTSVYRRNRVIEARMPHRIRAGQSATL